MFYPILILWIFLDFITKNLAYTYLENQISIVWSFLYLQYAENTWIAFSIHIPSFFLKILTLTLIIAIFYYYKQEKKKSEKNKNIILLDISFWLILAWAIWNWIERVFYGKVIDFIWVKYFAIFNLADAFITLWALLYISLYFRNNK